MRSQFFYPKNSDFNREDAKNANKTSELVLKNVVQKMILSRGNS